MGSVLGNRSAIFSNGGPAALGDPKHPNELRMHGIGGWVLPS